MTTSDTLSTDHDTRLIVCLTEDDELYSLTVFADDDKTPTVFVQNVDWTTMIRFAKFTDEYFETDAVTEWLEAHAVKPRTLSATYLTEVFLGLPESERKAVIEQLKILKVL